jgi:hypothetical protein
VEPQVERAQQFEKPLVHERLRHDDQHALRAAGEQQPVEIRQASIVLPRPTSSARSTGEQPRGHLRGDAELVRQQIDASAGNPEPSDWRRCAGA